ncbi:hypothetical protein BLNAU_16974 [Blattamonas nauphoetae]|uniref:Uncharacterized protein n=1 Tax=Blattamonas nauphoetae TaxID=2049346 RepID=A0ABQ9XCT3_9EUKA|nr:hypothetical protein BLNAU_16974 [Blattamonas nauphoetae]
MLWTSTKEECHYWLQIVECSFAACRSMLSAKHWTAITRNPNHQLFDRCPSSTTCLAVRSNSGTDTLRSVVHAALFAFTHFPVWLIWKVCGGRPRVTQDPSRLHTNEKLTEQQGKPSRSRSGDEIVFCKHSLLIFCNCGKIFVVKFVAGECVVLTAVEKAGGEVFEEFDIFQDDLVELGWIVDERRVVEDS